MGTPLTSADRKQMQLDLLWNLMDDNELLPYSPVKSLNKQLNTDNKSVIKAFNELLEKLEINNTTVTNFNSRFNDLVGNYELESADWTNLKKIDRNVIRSVYKLYLSIGQLTSNLELKSDINHTHTLSNITDVDVTTKSDGYILQYDSTASKFKSKPFPNTNGVSSVIDSTTNGNIVVDGVEINVYTHPSSHAASIITQDSTHKFVTDSQITSWDAKATASNVYTKSEIDSKIQAVIGAAPASLDTLSELANALGNDASFSTTVTNNLANKVDKISGKGLSESDFTSIEKTKLSGIATGANNYVHPTGDGNLHVPATSTTSNGKYLKAGATAGSLSWNNIVAADITQDSSNRFVTDAEKTTWNAKAPTSVVTTSINGLMSSSDKTKLDGIATGANNYIHPASHPATMIVEDSTHRFTTDAEKTTWNSLISTISTLQTQLADALSRINVLEGNPSGSVVEWQYDFIIPQSTGVYNLTSDPAWNRTLTIEDVYGQGLNGLNPKMKLLTLGVQDGAPNEPGQQLPRDGFDIFEAPSMHGTFQYDAELQQLIFQSAAMNPYYFRIIKYV